MENTVVVGPKEALRRRRDRGGPVLLGGSAAGRGPSRSRCEVQIRAHADPVPATARGDGCRRRAAVVVPDDPSAASRPGETAVLYVGTRVIGQFTIDRTVSAVPAQFPRARESPPEPLRGIRLVACPIGVPRVGDEPRRTRLDSRRFAWVRVAHPGVARVTRATVTYPLYAARPHP